MAASREGHYRGVRERPCGHYATEICDQWKKTRVWLGTFDTPDVSAVEAATTAGGDNLGAAEGGAPRVSEQGKQRRRSLLGFYCWRLGQATLQTRNWKTLFSYKGPGNEIQRSEREDRSWSFRGASRSIILRWCSAVKLVLRGQGFGSVVEREEFPEYFDKYLCMELNWSRLEDAVDETHITGWVFWCPRR
ncbi:hypothetical protein RHGRI_034455 [Rhododendron griersonianum]|uniref:AP2/ERF domain-containing protein n=1 Tax=Rhododendron griersonianum TaxID=479676 RepID=A0AAV6I153_9ERIC|nr:hypothetical protein RHGRI_034455 [Rhododendron griersonianum]